MGRWWPLWVGISAPIIVAIILGSIIAYDLRLSLSITHAGLENFHSYMKIPLWVAALAFPVAALLASIHRSIEAHRQISLVVEQNTFSNFFKHRDDFFKFLEAIEKEKGLRFESKTSIYSLFFPRNSAQWFSPTIHAREEGNGLWLDWYGTEIKNILSEVGAFKPGDPVDHKTIRSIYLRVAMLGEAFKILLEGEACVKVYWLPPDFPRIAFSVSDPLRQLRLVQDVIAAIASFGFYGGRVFNHFLPVSRDFSVAAYEVFSNEEELKYMSELAALSK